jgi:hypothetical protein
VSSLTVVQVNASACRVLDARGMHVGNLKLIDGRWKFKAIGYDQRGAVVPGGGPLTDRHNALFDTPDAAVISAAFARA